MISLVFFDILKLPHTVISNSEKLTHPNGHALGWRDFEKIKFTLSMLCQIVVGPLFIKMSCLSVTSCRRASENFWLLPCNQSQKTFFLSLWHGGTYSFFKAEVPDILDIDSKNILDRQQWVGFRKSQKSYKTLHPTRQRLRIIARVAGFKHRMLVNHALIQQLSPV